MKSSEIREKFLKYFESNNHEIIKSASLLPANDPTLFFVNAGMVPFKDVFLGVDKRNYKRATSSQKCMRVSGKHNDLENVGRTPRHHTFFEMLGNFSFGDYFKKEAISYAWEFLTKEILLPKDQLYITVYKDDDEAEKMWKKHVDRTRIFRLGDKDNFWSMGETGPNGPCSEIIFDRNPGKPFNVEDFDTDRFLEIWNLVFMQFNKSADGKVVKLAKPSIDTGMGLERLVSVLENVSGNYETDLFMPVICQLEDICSEKYSSDYSGKNQVDVSMRVIADHIRAMTFLIGDGVQPSNEGRGYVLRRIIRRAARHGRLLKIEKSFFTPLAHIVIDLMGASYPELIQHKAFIEKVIQNEEERFIETLDKGLEILEKKFDELRKKSINILPGEDVFKLYDTFGFPKDLTEDIALNAKFTIDENGFNKCMNDQRVRARSAWKGSGEEKIEAVYKKVSGMGIKTKFIGYNDLTANAEILKIIHDGKIVESAEKGAKVDIIFDQTPFYGESGGQLGDAGMGVNDDVEISVTNTRKPCADLFVHDCILEKGKIQIGDKLTIAVDSERRHSISSNHTATHILHKALRQILGEHVKQAGSMVTADRLRFDFSHFTGLTQEQLKEIEFEVNEIIRNNLKVKNDEMSYDEAVSKGALAFFGDKYGKEVRMVSIGEYSYELCGGAHVKNTGEIGMIRIVSESSVAAGIRRIEAITGRGVEKYINNLDKDLDDISKLLRSSKSETVSKVKKILEDNKTLQKEIEKLKSSKISGEGNSALEAVEKVGNFTVMVKNVGDINPKELRSVADSLRSKIGSGVVVLVAETESKTSILVAVTSDLTKEVMAGQIIKDLVSQFGGTGGGRPDFAQGGIPITGAFKDLKAKLTTILSK